MMGRATIGADDSASSSGRQYNTLSVLDFRPQYQLSERDLEIDGIRDGGSETTFGPFVRIFDRVSTMGDPVVGEESGVALENGTNPCFGCGPGNSRGYRDDSTGRAILDRSLHVTRPHGN